MLTGCGFVMLMLPEKKPLPATTRVDAIADRLRITRQALGLRHVDVCRATGIKSNAYANYETGHRRPNLDDMIRYAETFGVTLDWIYRGDPSGLRHALAQKVLKLD